MMVFYYTTSLLHIVIVQLLLLLLPIPTTIGYRSMMMIMTPQCIINRYQHHNHYNNNIYHPIRRYPMVVVYYHYYHYYNDSIPNTKLFSSSSSTGSTSNNNHEHDTTYRTKQQQQRRRMGELTKPEQIVYTILQQMVVSKYSFRVIVIGYQKQVIFESTVQQFGPIIKITQSPSTGTNMVTIANEDQSFEYHLQLEQICKICFVMKDIPLPKAKHDDNNNNNNNTITTSKVALEKRCMIRMLNDVGESITTFILINKNQPTTTMNENDEEYDWFVSNFIEPYGNEIQL